MSNFDIHSGLFSAIGPDSYCGPTAIAALTGVTVWAAENAVLDHRAANGKPRRERMPRGVRVKTMWNIEIEPVLKRLGFSALCLPIIPGTSLASFVRHARLRYPTQRLMVLHTGHFIAFREGYFVDSAHRTPTPIKQYRHKRKAIRFVWLISKIEG